MVPAEGAAVPPTDSEWTDKDVRRLLQLLQRPHQLESFELARELCFALGIPSAYQATITAIDQTFQNRGILEKKLRDMIWQCDVEARITQAEAASEMGLSTRQFFRYRSEAVRALLNHIRKILADPPAEMKPLAVLARLFEGTDPALALRFHEINRTDASNEAYVAARVAAGDSCDDVATNSESASLSNSLAVALAREMHGDRAAALERSILRCARWISPSLATTRIQNGCATSSSA